MLLLVSGPNAQADFAFQQIAHGDRLEVLATGDDNLAIFVGDITGIEEIWQTEKVEQMIMDRLSYK